MWEKLQKQDEKEEKSGNDRNGPINIRTGGAEEDSAEESYESDLTSLDSGNESDDSTFSLGDNSDTPIAKSSTSKTRWSDHENNELACLLSGTVGPPDWEEIVSRLGTGRTPDGAKQHYLRTRNFVSDCEPE